MIGNPEALDRVLVLLAGLAAIEQVDPGRWEWRWVAATADMWASESVQDLADSGRLADLEAAGWVIVNRDDTDEPGLISEFRITKAGAVRVPVFLADD